MTIDDIYKKRINYYREHSEYPIIFIISEEERDKLIIETRLLPLDTMIYISNLLTTDSLIEFKLFNILISTEERERK